MRKTSIILGLIFAVLALVLAVLPLYKLAFIPAVLAFIFGIIAFLKSKKEAKPTHVIQVIFLLTIISLGLATYKTIFTVSEVGDTKDLQQTEDKLNEEAKEELDDLIIID
ncbi:FUSC family protein [Olleya namhaensis]|uniref:FUSC family protein n=1 Tax=Olleya namhaensis TaxID=1144750 RepID=UPI00232EE415|nr:FUSC family protein [Olleya namhaensis]